MKLKIVKTGKTSERLLKKLNNKIGVEVGHFKDQGNHDSGLTYPELMNKHHFRYTTDYLGTEVEVPGRPVLDIVGFKIDSSPNYFFNGIQDILNRKFTKVSVKEFLGDVGERVQREEQDIIGDASEIRANSATTIRLKQGRNTPLEDTGDLKSKVDVRVKRIK